MRRAAAALRRHRLLPDHGRVRARRRSRRVLEQVRRARERRCAGARARPAGASREQLHQPRVRGRATGRRACAVAAALRWQRTSHATSDRPGGFRRAPTSSREIDRAAPDVGIVTLAPELDGGLDLIALARGARPSRVARAFGRDLRAGARRHRRRRAARDASVQPHAAAQPSRARAGGRDSAERRSRRGNHLRRRARASRGRADGVAAKRPSRIMAITDGTAAAGLPPGAAARARRTADHRRAARRRSCDDGTLAGSALTMDRRVPRRWCARRADAGGRRDDVCDDAGAGAGAGRPRRDRAGCGRRPGHARPRFSVVQTYIAGRWSTPGRNTPPACLGARSGFSSRARDVIACRRSRSDPSTPASTNASCRSRHLLHRPQCIGAPPPLARMRVHARQRQLERHAERRVPA